MNLLQSARIQCPYCGEFIELLIDCSVPTQEYIEDCSVCCQPLNLSIDAGEPDDLHIIASTDRD